MPDTIRRVHQEHDYYYLPSTNSTYPAIFFDDSSEPPAKFYPIVRAHAMYDLTRPQKALIAAGAFAIASGVVFLALRLLAAVWLVL
jgi:hypothetical protein